jgi:hypothetical protein
MNIFIVNFELTKTDSPNYNNDNLMKSSNKPLNNCFSGYLYLAHFTSKAEIDATGCFY